MAVYNFAQIRLYGEKRVKCSGCGKRLTRKKTFMQTENPFNKTEGGWVKSREEIHKELCAERQSWRDQEELCSRCASKGVPV